MKFQDEIAALRKRAAAYREASVDLLTTDSARARKILIAAEALEEKIKLLECASRLGAPATHMPFRRHWNGMA
jgi:hypothetical protein